MKFHLNIIPIKKDFTIDFKKDEKKLKNFEKIKQKKI